LHKIIFLGIPGWPGLPEYVSHSSAFAGKKENFLMHYLPSAVSMLQNDSSYTFSMSKKNLKTVFYEENHKGNSLNP
jgi:uncharacterized protein YbcC (UPF0753/DUF2309 family)